MAVMQVVPPSALAIEIMHQGAWPEYGMMYSHALMQALRGRMSNPPTREQDSLVRLSIRLDGNYCTVDPMESISMVNYASISDDDACTGMSEAEEQSGSGGTLRGNREMCRIRR